MASWGDGARAIVKVCWQGGGGHVFTALQENGQTIFVDSQTGDVDCSSYFSAGSFRPSETALVRVDNLDFTDHIEQCAKLREGGKT